jgi:hypothetical protein
MITRIFIKKHIISFAIIIFLIIYFIINHIKPHFLYTKDGHLRAFGLGYKNKTVIPLWLISIVVAILSYVGVLYWLALPKLKY